MRVKVKGRQRPGHRTGHIQDFGLDPEDSG